MVEENKDEKTINPTAKTAKANKNIWRYATIALLVIVVLLLVAFLWKPGETSVTGRMITESNEIANKTVDFLNKNIIGGGDPATLDSVNELSGILNITVLYQGRKIPIYATSDGKFLILPSGGIIDMSQPLPQPEEQPEETPQEIPKTDKPTVQLFVMAFCPYGIQAENAMKPVVDLLDGKVTIEPHFIVSISGTTVNSLHGEYEAKEDMRQACIWENYGQMTFWKYVNYINSNCNKNNLDTCWKDAAKNASIDVSKIETCVTNEGLNLMKAEEALSGQNGVSGSPTLIINGVTYSGARTPDAYKEAICNAFTTKPSECSQQLSTSGSTASGGC